jgi:MFS family permease
MLAAARQRLSAATGGLPRSFWVIWWGLLVNRLASFVFAFLSIYLVRDRGFRPAEAGGVLALYGVGSTVAGPLGGLLADWIGRRATMACGLLLGATSVGALAFARAPQVLALLAFLIAATGDIYRPAMGAAVADLVSPADRPRAYALVHWAVNLGLSVGLMLGGLVAQRSLVALFLADAGTSIAAAVVVLLGLPETRPPAAVHASALRGLAAPLTDGPFVSFLGLYLVGLLVFAQWQLGLPVDMAAHGFGPGAFALLMSLNCAGVVVLQPLLAPRLRRFDAAGLLAVSTALFGLGYGANAIGGRVWAYAAGTALWTLGEVVGFPVASAMVADLAPPALRGRYQGAFAMVWGVALSISPLAAGETLQRFGARVLWLACLAVALLASAGHLLTAAPRRRRLAAVHRTGTEPPASDLTP